MVKRIVEEGFRRWLQTSRNKFRLNNKFTIYTIFIGFYKNCITRQEDVQDEDVQGVGDIT